MKLEAMIFVKDMAKMTAFYSDGLGISLRVDESNEEWAVFDVGNSLLALHAIPPDIAATISVASPVAERSHTPIKLVFETADIEATRARLIAQGALVKEMRPWGAFDAVDPEGNIFQIKRAAD